MKVSAKKRNSTEMSQCLFKQVFKHIGVKHKGVKHKGVKHIGVKHKGVKHKGVQEQWSVVSNAQKLE